MGDACINLKQISKNLNRDVNCVLIAQLKHAYGFINQSEEHVRPNCIELLLQIHSLYHFNDCFHKLVIKRKTVIFA